MTLLRALNGPQEHVLNGLNWALHGLIELPYQQACRSTNIDRACLPFSSQERLIQAKGFLFDLRPVSLPGALLASLRPVASGIIADVTSEQRRGKVEHLDRVVQRVESDLK